MPSEVAKWAPKKKTDHEASQVDEEALYSKFLKKIQAFFGG